MSKFKLFLKLRKGYKNSVKCINLFKKFLMDKPNQSESDNSGNGTKKRIRVRKARNQQRSPDLNYSSSEEAFIPLSARDSKWVDLAFYNPNFGNQQEDEDIDEEELQTVGVDGLLKPPLLMLFPGLSEKDSANLKSSFGSMGSTSDITKLLVGQKPDFSKMRSSKKLFFNDNKLSSVQEIVQEENESATSSLNSYRLVTSTFSNKSVTERHESQESIPDYSKRKMKTKRRKKIPDSKIELESGSSSSLVEALRRRPSSRPRQRGNATIVRKDSELKVKTSNGSLGDDENENS